MNAAVLVLATVVVIAAAVRSTWSPCGLSMLSTITPVTERSRGHRYPVTATWFVVGAVAGGATLGAGIAALTLAVRATGWSTATGLGIAAALAAAAAWVDAGVLGRQPPFFKRQVADAWLGRYRPWVYGIGFGWQIGVGLATYIMTAAVLLLVALAALTGSPLLAFALGVLFGFARGLAVLLSAGLTTPAAMRALHDRLDGLEAPVRHCIVGIQALVATVAAGVAWGPLAGAAAAVLVAAPIAAGAGIVGGRRRAIGSPD